MATKATNARAAVRGSRKAERLEGDVEHGDAGASMDDQADSGDSS